MDPLLSSLCTICHIDPPKYTCPRCYVNTCSLTCSKRHKIWASCSGLRDPTKFKPMSELATPAGIDHDYNFLRTIEHRLERSEKLLVEEIQTLTKDELDRARKGEAEEPGKRRHNEEKGVACIAKSLSEMRCRVVTAPKGMRRNKENTSGWNKRHRTIFWQVEWMRGDPAERTLYRVLGNQAIGDVYDLMCEEERRMAMSSEELRAEKKRKAAEFNATRKKKARLEKSYLPNEIVPLLQDPENGTWSVTPTCLSIQDVTQDESPEPEPEIRQRSYHLYLHRPLTPSSFPKVLVPLDADKSLTELLREREVLEFPTIYVLDTQPEELPEKFMLERKYLAAIGKGPAENLDADTNMSDSSKDSSSDSSASSEEDSDVSMEDGEIA